MSDSEKKSSNNKTFQAHPKVFISYSWSSPEHEQWVLRLATELRESSVDVILDKWDLKEGHDAHAFMEKMVTDTAIKKVILVSDKKYAEKADQRTGGVGTETQIISPEIYKKQDQDKFVAVISEKDENGNAFLPAYYKSRIYIDLSEADIYAANFEQLLRWIYDKPMYIKPPLGRKPEFLNDEKVISLGTSYRYSRAIEAIRNSRDYSKGALQEYIDTVVENLEKFRITNTDGEHDDKVIENIELFLPYRNEIVSMFSTIAQYSNDRETHILLHSFFERLITYLDRPDNVSSYREWDYDNYKFIIHELFIYCIAVQIKYGAFDAVTYLLSNGYYSEKNIEYGRKSIRNFGVFRVYLKSLEYRNSRLSLSRLSLHADILQKRVKASGLSFEQLMQADFVIYIRDCVDTINRISVQSWYPVTLLYKSSSVGPFEIFARSESAQYFAKIQPMLGIDKKSDLDGVIKGLEDNKLYTPKWDYQFIKPRVLMNYDKLETRP